MTGRQSRGRLGNNIFPWMNHVIRKNVVLDEKDKVLDAEELEKKRRATRLPIGVKIDPEDDGLMDREKPLVLIGYGPAVKFVLDTITTGVLTARDAEHPDKLFTIVRFDGTEEDLPNQDYLLRLPRRAWTNCARSKDKLGEFVAKNIAPMMNKLPDLLVVDDLAATFTVGQIIGARGQTSGYAPFRLADANKRMAVWYKHVGMGMVAGVPTGGEKPIDCGSSELEQLRTYCTVRPVSVVRQADNLEAGKVRILVGKNAWYADVDAAVVEPQLQKIVKA